MCCGQKRSELRNSQTQRTMRPVPQSVSSNSHARGFQSQITAPVSMPSASVSISYQENSPIRVRGSVSGRFYEFSGSRPVQQVDARDASSLLNTRFFRRA
jgi:hypothetical protein